MGEVEFGGRQPLYCVALLVCEFDPRQPLAVQVGVDPVGFLLVGEDGVESDDEINERLKRASGINGVFILGIDPGSAAERAGLAPVARTPLGLTPGDVIVALNGTPVSRCGDLLARLDDYRAGQRVELTVVRGGEERTVSAVLEAGD